MTISIPDDVASKLTQRASVVGKTLPVYTAQLLAETVSKPSIDDLLAPVRDDFARSGRPRMSCSISVVLGRETLSSVRQEKKAKTA